ncbi:uncharacterized protein LOC110118300 [Ceratitis capitata]|uniref:uncharacterized protein LOC110118300 n=1 Tax=Ceratitis capitata TaxID=7213 RepID=UPI000A0F991A|nr:uncharacterized protein LOC110118300 [Ceratitis capitata]
MDTNKGKIPYIPQFFFDKGENASHAAENVNNVYGPNTITVNHAQFRFHSVENIDKIMNIVATDRNVPGMRWSNCITAMSKASISRSLHHISNLIAKLKAGTICFPTTKEIQIYEYICMNILLTIPTA